MQYMPNVVLRLRDSSSIWCAQIFALNTTTRSRHNRHQVDVGKVQGQGKWGRADAEADANRAGQTSSKLAYAKGPTAAALILAHINALKMQQEGRAGGECAAGVDSALHEYY